MFKLVPSCEDQIMDLYRQSADLARRVNSHTGKTLLVGCLCRGNVWMRFKTQPSIVLDDAGFAKIFAIERKHDVITTFAVHY